jgi:hypothetical protein
MGIPNQFNDIIKNHLNVFAAWIPIVNKYGLGDYGIFADGVFSKLGNIKDDFQVSFTEGSGAEASIDFTSSATTVRKFNAGAQVDVIPAATVDAKVEVGFQNENSFMVKSPVVTVAVIENVNAVAMQLKATGKWDGMWKVVYQVYSAQDAVIVSTVSPNTTLTFGGDVNALEKLKLGNAGVNISSDKALGLNIQGKSGVIGLGLFRIKTSIFGGSKTETLGEAIGDEDAEEVASPVSLSDNANDL